MPPDFESFRRHLMALPYGEGEVFVSQYSFDHYSNEQCMQAFAIVQRIFQERAAPSPDVDAEEVKRLTRGAS